MNQLTMGRVDPLKAERFRANLRQPPAADSDDIALADILLSGKTPWQAAKEVAHTSVAGRSVGGLHHRARRILKEIHTVLFGGLDEDMLRLMKYQEVRVPLDFLPILVERCREAGISVQLDVVAVRVDTPVDRGYDRYEELLKGKGG